MKPLELLREQRSLSHSIVYLMKFVGIHLNSRRKNHRITLFYKMMYNITPLYLSNLVPQSVSNLSRYNLRNSNDLQTVDARSSQYYHSFLPSTIRDWNSLSVETKQSDSVNSFKRLLNKGKSTVPNHYYIGNRKPRFFILVFVLIVAH